MVDFVKPRNDISISKEVWLPKRNVNYTLVPTTSKPMETGFTLSVMKLYSDVKITVAPFTDNAPLQYIAAPTLYNT